MDWYWGPIDTFEQERTGDVLIRWAVRLHFGRWRSHTLKAVWVVLGLLPAVMLVTGAAMWWRRVVVPRRRAAEAPRAADRVMALGREPQQVE